MRTKQIVLDFVEAVNRHDLAAMSRIMHPGHLFLDSLGRGFSGRDLMQDNWEGYFALFPDYTITLEDMLVVDDMALLTGRARANLYRDGRPVTDGHWDIPVAWKAIVTDGLLAHWQVYTDYKPVYDILEQEG